MQLLECVLNLLILLLVRVVKREKKIMCAVSYCTAVALYAVRAVSTVTAVLYSYLTTC